MKRSSRAGRFKKKLVSAETLVLEAPLIEAKVAPLKKAFRLGLLSAPELCALYIIVVLAHRFPRTWLGALGPGLPGQHQLNLPIEYLVELGLTLEPNVQKRLAQFKSVGDVLARFSLRSTPLAVNRALLLWSTGQYQLELLFTIPGPLEVLGQQKRGRRCVSVLSEASRASNFILGERDALSFTMHDLIHADHFYHENLCFQGQIGFYRIVDRALKQGFFDELLSSSAFAAEFDYLISDMNSHPLHLLKCLKAAIVYYGSGEGLVEDLLVLLDLPAITAHAFRAMNTGTFETEHAEELTRYCVGEGLSARPSP